MPPSPDGWFKTPRAVWRAGGPPLSPHAKLAYVALLSYAGAEGIAWPSQGTLAAACSLSRRQTQRALVELRRVGLVAVVRRKPTGIIYRVVWPRDAPNRRITGESDAPNRRTRCAHQTHQMRPIGAQERIRNEIQELEPLSLPGASAPAPPEREKLIISHTTNGETDHGFAEFWSSYPKKEEEDDARRAWRRLRPDAGLQSAILAAVAAWKQSRQWQQEGGGRFIPKPANWLRKGKWKDKPGKPGESLHSGTREWLARGARAEERRARAKADAEGAVPLAEVARRLKAGLSGQAGGGRP
jgi:hypothetical protein